MKAKVIIENGQTKIELSPENEFEKDIIEKVYGQRQNYDLEVDINATYNYGAYTKHKIEILVKERQKNESK